MNTLQVAGLLLSCAAALSVAHADIPRAMQAAAIDHPGGPEVLGVDGAGIVAAVGTLAVQFAKLRGARVLAIASGEDGISLVQRIR